MSKHNFPIGDRWVSDERGAMGILGVLKIYKSRHFLIVAITLTTRDQTNTTTFTSRCKPKCGISYIYNLAIFSSNFNILNKLCIRGQGLKITGYLKQINNKNIEKYNREEISHQTIVFMNKDLLGLQKNYLEFNNTML